MTNSTDVVTQDATTLTNEDMRKAKMSEWKSVIESEVQKMMVTVAELRKKIDGAKTSSKKQYYLKKFKKIQGETISLLNMLHHVTKDTPVEGAHEDEPTAAIA